MKKLFVMFAAVVIVASFTSCAKKCTCHTYVAGVAGPEKEVYLKDSPTAKKCADLNTMVDTPITGKTGVECK